MDRPDENEPAANSLLLLSQQCSTGAHNTMPPLSSPAANHMTSPLPAPAPVRTVQSNSITPHAAIISGTISNSSLLLKFPVHLIQSDTKNDVGRDIMKAILDFAKSSGGYSASFKHGKKEGFMASALEVLFAVTGPLYQ
jgi:hypothetical protein